MAKSVSHPISTRNSNISPINDVILLFVFMKFAKMSYSVPLGYIAVVGIQVEKTRGNPLEKYRGVPKGGVIRGGVIQGV